MPAFKNLIATFSTAWSLRWIVAAPRSPKKQTPRSVH
jgi:hypothetical protein